MIYIVIKPGEIAWQNKKMSLLEDDLIAPSAEQSELIATHKKAGKGRRLVIDDKGIEVALEQKLITSYSPSPKKKEGKK